MIGNPAHDLIRLWLSMASAARGSDLPGVTTAHMIEQIVEGYEASFGGAADVDDELPGVVQKAVKAALTPHEIGKLARKVDPISPEGV